MRLFMALLKMWAIGILTLAVLLHGSAVEAALAPAEMSYGSGREGDTPVIRRHTEAFAPKVAKNRHSSTDAHPPLSSVYKHYSSGRHKYVNVAHAPAASKHGRSLSSSPMPSPSPSMEATRVNTPVLPPSESPIGSSLHGLSNPSSTVFSLPSPPPSADCSSISCSDPLTYAASGSPCGCVMPIKVQLQLSVALYTFFPLVSVFAREIATSTSLKRSQVRIMGADAVDQQRDKTIVEVYLIPIGKEFNKSMAMSTYLKFWRKQVLVDNKQFGACDILYVHYPGLPPSPPSPLSSNAAEVRGPNNGSYVHGVPLKPLGVAIPKTRKRDSMRGSTIFIIGLSSFTLFSICAAFIAVLLYKRGCCSHRQRHTQIPEALLPLKQSAMTVGSRTSSTTRSFSSSTRTYAGTAKTFSYEEIEDATAKFNPSNILGEGGFGLVYSGVLDDGTRVAVKVLKKDDEQGSSEFLAEIEMLSRLHHRNLVKLIGICVEEQARCLVYELISNGSVDSHLHGMDRERTSLDWAARMKIALGAARALAYLHEDSNPRVIHRDFKSSNILLEDDFNPKVSDFGLAKSAIDEVPHTPTRVMGTFGYLAPEYAMTGHLLVKSDVYSYGVVLLELLTGRKPVDLSQPPGQENLVAWARPLLTVEQRLHEILDPTLNSTALMDSVVKVAAIASMCVQPEVSHRPFMGEVVQALKLVCNELDEFQELGPKLDTLTELPAAVDNKSVPFSGELSRLWLSNCGVSGYDSEDGGKVAQSATNLSTPSMGADNAQRKRYAGSGPLRKNKKQNFWQRLF